jgi:adenylate cyclase
VALREWLQPRRRGARAWLSGVLLALLITAALLGAKQVGWLDFPEIKLLDACFRVRGERTVPADLLMIALDDATMARVQRLSPVPRDLLASIVRRLGGEGAKTIVLDVVLPDRLAGHEDAQLIDAMASAGNVILPVTKEGEQWRRPASAFGDVAISEGVAHVETVDLDHVVRWYQPVESGRASLALAAYAHFRDRDLGDFVAAGTFAELGRRLGQTLDPDGHLLIDFVGPSGAMKRESAADLLDGRVPPERVRGKLVIVGGTWSGARDLHFVPTGGWLDPLDQRLMPGPEVQANCMAGLLAPAPLRLAGEGLNTVLLLFVVLAASMGMVFFQPTAAALWALAIGGIWITLGLQWFTRASLVVEMASPPVGIALAYLASALVTERRARHLRRHFRRYVGRAIADRIAEMSDAEIGRMGRSRVVTLLFSDIRGYTRFSSTLPPEEIVSFLNRYFERMTACALAQNGFVDKYIGDGLMAIFGMFIADESGAEGVRDAAHAALAMRDALHALQKQDPRFQGHAIGIGLHTGRVVVGEIGTPEKTEFTAIGSAVNLASRIESETKHVFEEYKERGECPAVVILMSHVTHGLLAGEVEARAIGAASIRGLEDEEVRLWELLGKDAR